PGGVFSFTTPSQECLERDVQAGPLMADFNADLAAGSVPRFNFLIPNGCEDALGGCAPIHNRYTQFDEVLRREVPLIEASPTLGTRRTCARSIRSGVDGARQPAGLPETAPRYHRFEHRPRLQRRGPCTHELPPSRATRPTSTPPSTWSALRCGATPRPGSRA